MGLHALGDGGQLVVGAAVDGGRQEPAERRGSARIVAQHGGERLGHVGQHALGIGFPAPVGRVVLVQAQQLIGDLALLRQVAARFRLAHQRAPLQGHVAHHDGDEQAGQRDHGRRARAQRRERKDGEAADRHDPRDGGPRNGVKRHRPGRRHSSDRQRQHRGRGAGGDGAHHHETQSPKRRHDDRVDRKSGHRPARAARLAAKRTADLRRSEGRRADHGDEPRHERPVDARAPEREREKRGVDRAGEAGEPRLLTDLPHPFLAHAVRRALAEAILVELRRPKPRQSLCNPTHDATPRSNAAPRCGRRS